MPINVENFINSLNLKSKNSDFQDLEHLDGVSISTVCANLYSKLRDDLVMFYFRDGANYASVYTQSKIVSENIKWNLNIKSKKISSLIINTRNANAFTGSDGYKGLKEIADEAALQLTKKQTEDEDFPKKISSNQVLFGCTGTIGEKYPTEKIKKNIPELIKKIKKGEVLLKSHYEEKIKLTDNEIDFCIEKNMSLPVRLHDLKDIEKEVDFVELARIPFNRYHSLVIFFVGIILRVESLHSLF